MASSIENKQENVLFSLYFYVTDIKQQLNIKLALPFIYKFDPYIYKLNIDTYRFK